jgi:IS605 OrfB family transposase
VSQAPRAVTHTDHRDPVQVRRAYKLRAYPTRPQEGRAVQLLADHCDLYNAALQERRDAWRMQRVSVSYGQQSAQLREIRAADPNGQGRHSFTAQQQTLRRLNTVFAAYFQHVRDAEKAKRRDLHHKTARALVDTCDALALEALRVDGMTASASGTVEQPGTTVAAKSGLNRSILDTGWARFTIILTAKAESAGRRVVRVDPSYTSVTCHTCGARCGRPRQDAVVCPAGQASAA